MAQRRITTIRRRSLRNNLTGRRYAPPVSISLASVAETGAAGDVLAAATSFIGVISETGNATDIDAGIAILHDSVVEDGSASDTAAIGSTLLATVSEAGSASDVEAAVNVAAASVSEVAEAADAETAANASTASVSETSPAADTETATDGGLVVSNINKWVAGGTSAYTSLTFSGTPFNSLIAATGFVLTSTAIDNTTALDMFMDVSFVATMASATTAANGDRLGLYIMPLNEDGTTYGDGIGTGTALPSPGYLAAICGINGTTVTGTFPRIMIRDVSFQIGIANLSAVAFAASAAATIKYRTRNITNNG